MAPTPISSEASPVANTMAMIGIIVSGRAVPTAVRPEPTAPSASSSFRPNHSMLLVNSSSAGEDDDEGEREDEDLHAVVQDSVMRVVTTPMAMTARVAIEMASILHSGPRPYANAAAITRMMGSR